MQTHAEMPVGLFTETPAWAVTFARGGTRAEARGFLLDPEIVYTILEATQFPDEWFFAWSRTVVAPVCRAWYVAATRLGNNATWMAPYIALATAWMTGGCEAARDAGDACELLRGVDRFRSCTAVLRVSLTALHDKLENASLDTCDEVVDAGAFASIAWALRVPVKCEDIELRIRSMCIHLLLVLVTDENVHIARQHGLVALTLDCVHQYAHRLYDCSHGYARRLNMLVYCLQLVERIVDVAGATDAVKAWLVDGVTDAMQAAAGNQNQNSNVRRSAMEIWCQSIRLLRLLLTPASEDPRRLVADCEWPSGTSAVHARLAGGRGVRLVVLAIGQPTRNIYGGNSVTERAESRESYAETQENAATVLGQLASPARGNATQTIVASGGIGRLLTLMRSTPAVDHSGTQEKCVVALWCICNSENACPTFVQRALDAGGVAAVERAIRPSQTGVVSDTCKWYGTDLLRVLVSARAARARAARARAAR